MHGLCAPRGLLSPNCVSNQHSDLGQNWGFTCVIFMEQMLIKRNVCLKKSTVQYIGYLAYSLHLPTKPFHLHKLNKGDKYLYGFGEGKILNNLGNCLFY